MIANHMEENFSAFGWCADLNMGLLYILQVRRCPTMDLMCEVQSIDRLPRVACNALLCINTKKGTVLD